MLHYIADVQIIQPLSKPWIHATGIVWMVAYEGIRGSHSLERRPEWAEFKKTGEESTSARNPQCVGEELGNERPSKAEILAPSS